MVVAGDLRGHPPHVQLHQLPALLPRGAQRQRVQRAAAGPPEAVQLEPGGHTLPEPGQILPGESRILLRKAVHVVSAFQVFQVLILSCVSERSFVFFLNYD